MAYLLFCNADENGNITDSFSGVNIIPDRQFDYFFYTNDKGVIDNIGNYFVDIDSRQLMIKTPEGGAQ
ncbi:hypothetical protein [Mesobacillus zeae]|uniref:hypothetical protein n=1 Tax=Mesobacillus zeae TaxID=1917180 RepID=UPI00300A8488